MRRHMGDNGEGRVLEEATSKRWDEEPARDEETAWPLASLRVADGGRAVVVEVEEPTTDMRSGLPRHDDTS